MKTSPPRRRTLSPLHAAAAAAIVLALFGLTACSGDDPTTATDPAADSSSAPVDGSTAEPGSLPEFPHDDYTYVLEVFCYCPLTGPVKVTVEDGRVAEAVTTKKAPGLPKGSKAPEFLSRTINDLIAIANDPEVDDVEVAWADGADHPSKIVTDPIENAVDDEATYSIRDVTVG